MPRKTASSSGSHHVLKSSEVFPYDVDAVLTADLHLREDTPECRTDDYWKAQWTKIRFIQELCQEHTCPLIVAGDIFHHWKPSPRLLSTTIQALPVMAFVPGQHDLPEHSQERYQHSGCSVLEATDTRDMDDLFICLKEHHAFKYFTAYGLAWGEDKPSGSIPPKVLAMLVTHRMTWHNTLPFPDCKADSATKLLQKFPQYKLILTGDNHQRFIVEHEGRLLVNPGSMMRMTAAQANHRPAVYLWNAHHNVAKPVFLPITPSEQCISRAHIERQEEKDGRIASFVKRLKSESVEAGLDFEENMKRHLSKNKISEAVKNMIWKAMEKEA